MFTRACVAVLLVVCSGGLSRLEAATIYDFSVTTNFGTTLLWSLPSQPTPSVVGSSSFTMEAVDVDFNGTPTPTDIQFFNASGGGIGFDFPTSSLDFIGCVVFSGPLTSPTFNLGSCGLIGGVQTGFGTVTVSLAPGQDPPTPPVPEPATVLLLAAGLLGVARRHWNRPVA
jgi:hypothetical protein